MSGDAETVRAREALQWLADNDEGMFNICCQRCDAPFEHSGQAVAAPAEWFGVLIEQRRLAEDVIALVGRVADAEKALQGVRLHVDAISILARSPYPTEHAFAAGMLRIAELAALSGAVEAGVAQNSWRERGSAVATDSDPGRGSDAPPSTSTPPGDFYPSDCAG